VTQRSKMVTLALSVAMFATAAAGVLPSRPAQAQRGPKAAAAKAAQKQQEEADLPNVDAIEKGAPAPASMSFPRGLPAAVQNAVRAPGDQNDEADRRAAAAGARRARIEGAAVDLIPPGGLFGLEGTRGATDEEEPPAPGATPEFHVVKKGDTLWSLCDGYFKDPWRWPKLWSQNPRITNPHWIFPGDVVRLQAAAPAGTAVADGAAGSGAAAPGMGGPPRRGGAGSNALVLREVGYVEAKDLEASGVISGSREEKIMLSTGDQAYIGFDKAKPLKAGERYTVFRVDKEHPLRAPGSPTILGYVVRIYGDVLVDQIADGGTARGTLVDMMEPVERGDLVSPQVRQFRRVEPRPSAVNLQTRIVASLTPMNLLAAETFVVLSRGKKDGVEIGNRTFVVRRADGYRRVLEGWDHFDPNMPNEVVGELWVVDVREDTSLAWIARTSKEIRVGEIAEMRKGH
jgi:hypothetical protein